MASRPNLQHRANASSVRYLWTNTQANKKNRFSEAIFRDNKHIYITLSTNFFVGIFLLLVKTGLWMAKNEQKSLYHSKKRRNARKNREYNAIYMVSPMI